MNTHSREDLELLIRHIYQAYEALIDAEINSAAKPLVHAAARGELGQRIEDAAKVIGLYRRR